ncbi:MAG: hypothetical protein ACTSUP_02870 [Candidatus Heimdallarchaeaceae archaeon]
MGKKTPNYQKRSLMDFAVQGFKNIKKLSESSLISEKLLGLNSLLFVLILAIITSSWLFKNESFFTLEFLIIFLLSLLIAFAISLIYSPILKLIANYTKDKVVSLRIGLIILFINLPISVASLLFRSLIISKITLGILVLQLLVVLFGSWIQYSKTPYHDDTVGVIDLWKVIDRVAAICGILSFIITITLLLIK